MTGDPLFPDQGPGTVDPSLLTPIAFLMILLWALGTMPG
jgi:hypothetical protein